MEEPLPLHDLPSVAMQGVDQGVRHWDEAWVTDSELMFAVVFAGPDVVEDMHDEHHGGSIERHAN